MRHAVPSSSDDGHLARRYRQQRAHRREPARNPTASPGQRRSTGKPRSARWRPERFPAPPAKAHTAARCQPRGPRSRLPRGCRDRHRRPQH
jgi:hypothetical protein